MALPQNKTKIVCTIGPASESLEMMCRLLEAGMNIARLNFSHGDFSAHKKVIDNLRGSISKDRQTSCDYGRPVRAKDAYREY